VNEKRKKEKVKRAEDEEVNEQGRKKAGKWYPAQHGVPQMTNHP